MQFVNNGTLTSYIGCDGDYTDLTGSGNSVTLGGAGYALSASAGGVILRYGPLIASGGFGTPLSATSGQIYSITGDASGAITFGLVGGGPFHACALSWSYPTLTAGCASASTSSILAGSSTGPALTAGDLGASRSASTGALTLGGSTSSDTIDFGVTSSGSETHSQPVVVPNLKNTGFSSSTVSPLCGSSNTNEAQCTLTATYATTGSTSAGTGTTANTYQQLGATLSITTGLSHGPNAEWLVTIEEPLNMASASTGYVYGCFASSSSFTVQDNTSAGAATCVTSLTGSIAGTPGFGGASIAQTGLSAGAIAHVLVANNSTFSVKFYVAGSGATSNLVFGYGSVEAVPY